MDKVRVAIVGCGTISHFNGPGYVKNPGSEVYALCDPVRERAESRAREWGIDAKIYTEYEEVLNDPRVDAVELLSPTHLHGPQIIAGLEAGKHVSCQKPICPTVKEADQVIAAAARASTKFRTTENFIFYPPIVKAKELIDSGAIGEPSSVRARAVMAPMTSGRGMTMEPDALEWRRRPEHNPGGLLYDNGWHRYVTALTWIGGEVEKVISRVTRTEDFMIEAPSVVVWKFKDRDCLGIVEEAYARDMKIRSKYYPLDEFFEIQGSKGVIWVTRCSGEILDLPPVMLMNGSETVEFQVPTDWMAGFDGAADHFIECILQDKQPDLDAEFSKRVLQLALAAYQASDTGRPVEPDSVT